MTILERGKSVLEKVRISGGGRCNVTHACFDPKDLTAFYPRGGRELRGPFHHFACGDTMGWFEDRGVPLKIEEDGRVFPVSDDSQSIIDCLWQTAKRLGVDVRTRSSAADPRPLADGGWAVPLRSGEELRADKLVITTGSNPTVWKTLGRLGHTLVDPVPSLFTFDIQDQRISGLAGISLPWVALRIDGQKLSAEGPLLVTHRGLSGPAILRLSAWGARELAGGGYRFPLHVNWTNHRPQDVAELLAERRTEWAKRQIGNYPLYDLPQRLWQRLVQAARIPDDRQWAQLTSAQSQALVEQLTDARFSVTGKSTHKEEFVTAGGVDLKEVDFRDFSSRKLPNLHLAGEVLDIDAITGGFNFQAAWTGGYLIGQSGAGAGVK